MKYKVTLNIGYISGHEDIIEIEDEELEGLTEDEKDKYLDDAWKDWAWNYIDGSITKVD